MGISAPTPDATTTKKGKLQLAGDLGGTADSPTVTKTYSKTDVGLGNVDNTSDANKPVSTAAQTALDLKVAKAGDTMSGSLDITRAAGANTGVQVFTSGDTNARVALYAAGTLAWGTGAAGVDVNLYRGGSNELKTDDTLNVAINNGKTSLQLSNTTVGVGMTIGADTNLYRSAADTLKTDDTLIVGVAGTAAGSAVTIDGTQTLTAKTLTTPTIGSFTNATHDHSNAAGGGVLTHTAFPSGTVVQLVDAPYTSSTTGTTLMVRDNTIPQNTEGDQYMTISITPKASANKLIIEGAILLAHSLANNTHMVALFQDSTANALGANAVFQPNATTSVVVPFYHSMTAGTTSSTTFKLRAGGNQSGTTTFNSGYDQTTPFLFGAITKSWMKITEVKA